MRTILSNLLLIYSITVILLVVGTLVVSFVQVVLG
jgi:hypothetical protein